MLAFFYYEQQIMLGLYFSVHYPTGKYTIRIEQRQTELVTPNTIFNVVIPYSTIH